MRREQGKLQNHLHLILNHEKSLYSNCEYFPLMLSDGMVQLIMQTYRDGEVSSRTQDVWYTSLSFYSTVNHLKRMGLMKEKHKNPSGKTWELTEEGRLVVEYYKKIDEVVKKCREEKQN